MESISHQQFVDDTLLCEQSSLQEAKVIRRTTNTFCRATGQQVNWEKSEVLFFNTKGNRQQEISNILGVKMGTLPGKFLGTPLFGGLNHTALWNNLIDSCANCLEGWKSKWLTLVGRIMFLKLVLSALPIYSMTALKIPKKVISYINRGMKKFLWNGKETTYKIPLVAWDKVCQSKQARGLGFWNWTLLNQAMGAKLIWQIYSHQNQKWTQILKHKYLDQMSRERIFTINALPKGSAIWNFIVSCRHVITEHITWELDNGTSAKFWTDSWDGRLALSERQSLEDIKQVTNAQWGEKVGDFLTKSRVHGVDLCEWKEVDNLPLTSHHKDLLKTIMQEYTPTLSNKEDTLRWCGSKSGQY
ncbi:uncharacterized protein LOC131860408 [Cryptomeria japonica]|uniref:uncharacterized protein LOC131860408 n=1 Tax=Cryptomeria japonica TaxID=3369 RepID=UPI0027DA4AC5|nr:uncharacterized protein LOC131860408 [Cryptomeria japonica]